MMIAELLKERGIDRALIIDDGYDAVPTADDLVGNADAWQNFFADIALHADLLNTAYPEHETTDADVLIARNDFVLALWNNKDALGEETSEALFGQFSRDTAYDRTFLEKLESQLRELGVEPVSLGRSGPAPEHNIPLIFVDLFLGGAQDDAAERQSIHRILEIVSTRHDDPPLIVLMSRSTRLDARKEEFRRASKLLGAMFRVSTKSALEKPDMFVRVLSRLAQNRQDGRKIAKLLNTWDQGLEDARERFMDKVRTLDLPDYAQIKDLLLAFEGQPLGSYLIDVFDRVLQYEIEQQPALIEAAADVNTVNLERYLAPNIAGSPDLQRLVFSTIYQNPERMGVVGAEDGLPLMFGDVLIPRGMLAGSAQTDLPKEVLIVMTPACDLARGGSENVLLIEGKLKPLTPTEWTYGEAGIRTPIIIMPDESRYWIKWDLKSAMTWHIDDVAQNISEDGAFFRYVRLRESAALELQQKMLSNLGRVGQIAHMPASFPIGVSLYCPDSDGNWTEMVIDSLAETGGVEFVGRDGDSKPNSRLVLSERVCDEIASAISAIKPVDVPENAKVPLARLQAALELLDVLESGLDISKVKDSWKEFKTVASDGDSSKQETVALIARNADPETLGNRDLRKAAVAILLRDNEKETEAELGCGVEATDIVATNTEES